MDLEKEGLLVFCVLCSVNLGMCIDLCVGLAAPFRTVSLHALIFRERERILNGSS